MGFESPPQREPPNFQFGGGLKPLLLPVAQTVRAIREGIYPFSNCPLPFLNKFLKIAEQLNQNPSKNLSHNLA